MDVAPPGEPGARPPRVVLFRNASIESDTRGKKIALSLARGGYEVIVLSAVPPGTPTEPMVLGAGSPNPVLVRPVRVGTSTKDVQNLVMGARRRRVVRLVDRTPVEEYRTQVAELRRAVRDAGARTRRWRARASTASPPARLLALPAWVLARAGYAAALGRLILRRRRWKIQASLTRERREAWSRWDERRLSSTFLATTRGTLPEVEDFGVAVGPVLDELAADVLHVHHPIGMPTAVQAARRRRAAGHPCRVVYDARENFAGIPPGGQGNPRRHAVLVRQESGTIRDVDMVITVSEPIAEELQRRYRLPRAPLVLLNTPVVRAAGDGPRLRTASGLDEATPLAVYSGGITRGRGIELLIDALPKLPGVHLALVTVPHPHPMSPELVARAVELGVADRLHVLPPVAQDDLIPFLASADVAVHPLPGGSANHDQAMPNKLFEYLHAGVPLVVSDARLLADFVRSNGVGAVFRTGDADDLASAIGAMLASPPDASTLATVAARYEWVQQEEVLLDAYAALAPLPAGVSAPAIGPGVDFPELEVRPPASGGAVPAGTR